VNPEVADEKWFENLTTNATTCRVSKEVLEYLQQRLEYADYNNAAAARTTPTASTTRLNSMWFGEAAS